MRDVAPSIGAFQWRESLTVGAYKPDDTNTGLLPGVSLSVHEGDYVASPGEHIQNLEIRGRLRVLEPDVTIDNCWVRGADTDAYSSDVGLIEMSGTSANTVVRDCLIEPRFPSEFTYGIRRWRYTAKRLRIKHVVDGIGAFPNSAGNPANVFIYGCWVSDLTRFNPSEDQSDGSHCDCIQIEGGVGTNNIIVRGNRLECYLSSTYGNTSGMNRQSPTAYNTGTAAIMLNSNVGDTSGLLIENNWLSGGEIGINGGGITEAVAIGTIRRNKFNHGQTLSGLHISNPGNTWAASMNPIPTFTVPTGDDANVYEDNNQAINFRRTA